MIQGMRNRDQELYNYWPDLLVGNHSNPPFFLCCYWTTDINFFFFFFLHIPLPFLLTMKYLTRAFVVVFCSLFYFLLSCFWDTSVLLLFAGLPVLTFLDPEAISGLFVLSHQHVNSKREIILHSRSCLQCYYAAIIFDCLRGGTKQRQTGWQGVIQTTRALTSDRRWNLGES